MRKKVQVLKTEYFILKNSLNVSIFNIRLLIVAPWVYLHPYFDVWVGFLFGPIWHGQVLGVTHHDVKGTLPVLQGQLELPLDDSTTLTQADRAANRGGEGGGADGAGGGDSSGGPTGAGGSWAPSTTGPAFLPWKWPRKQIDADRKVIPRQFEEA